MFIATVPFDNYIWLSDCQCFICIICLSTFQFVVVLGFFPSFLSFPFCALSSCFSSDIESISVFLKNYDLWYWISGIKPGLILLLFSWWIFWAVILATSLWCVLLVNLVLEMIKSAFARVKRALSFLIYQLYYRQYVVLYCPLNISVGQFNLHFLDWLHVC